MSALSIPYMTGNVSVTAVGSLNILVNPLDFSASHVLTRLKMQKNKFTKPFFKKPAKLLPSERLASKVVGEVFEREHGEEIAEFIKQIKSNVSSSLHFGNEIPSRLNEVTESLKPKAPKTISPAFMQEIRERAKVIEAQAVKRTAAAIKIQSYWRMILAILRVSDLKVFKRAARMIKRFLSRLADRTKRINRGLELLRLHFWSSVITQFMRKSCRILKTRRIKAHREGLIRAVLNGIKARMIFNIPRMQETKLLVKNLMSQHKETRRNTEDERHLMDEIKYQKNLYINLYYKYWTKRLSVLEEMAKETRERENRKKRTSVNADSGHNNQRALRKAPSIQANIDVGMNQSRSKVNSRAPSMDIDEPSRSGSLAFLGSHLGASRAQADQSGASEGHLDERPIKPMGSGPINLDDRPIKPMGAGGFGGLGSMSELDPTGEKVRRNSKGTRDNSSGGKKREKQASKSEEASDKVKKQRELMDKRRKYDPRKALQGASSNDTEESTEVSEKSGPRIKIKAARNREELENIAENLSEERSLNGFGDEVAGEGAGGAGREDRPKKEFLKRKTKKVEFHKVDWSNVQGRTDCWGGQKEDSVPKPVKKETSKVGSVSKPKPPAESDQNKAHDTSNRTANARDLSMIKLKGEDGPRAGESSTGPKIVPKKAQKPDKKDSLLQIEETLSSSYLPKLQEVLSKEVLREPSSAIPVVQDQSRFALFIEEQDLQTVLQQLEDEYDFLINN